MASLSGCLTHRRRRQGIFNYNPGPSRISGVLTEVTDMSTGMLGFVTERACMACIALILALISMDFTSAMGSHYAQGGNGRPQDLNEWKYGILRAAEEVVRAGVLSYAPGSESERVSPVSQSIDWSFLFWCWCWGLVVVGLLWRCRFWVLRSICVFELSTDDLFSISS